MDFLKNYHMKNLKCFHQIVGAELASLLRICHSSMFKLLLDTEFALCGRVQKEHSVKFHHLVAQSDNN